MLNKLKLEETVQYNFKKVKLRLLFIPVVLLITIAFFLFKLDALTIEGYINVQKEVFFELNKELSKFSSLQFNLTQLGDVLIFFPFLTIFMLYAPKLWESLLTSALISLIFSATLKKLFSVPRPAAIFDVDSFTIIGRTLKGSTSLPSGHSIATFVVLSVVLFAFMPKKNKILWSISIIVLGIIIALSRVGVGAHYPIDVLVGCIIGYVSAIIGIVLDRKIKLFTWIKNKKTYPILLLLLLVLGVAIVKKITVYNLLVFYISLFFLGITLYLMTNIYVKKKY